MSIMMQAFNQWSNRPADERFKSLAELHAAVMAIRNIAKESKDVVVSKLRIVADLLPGAKQAEPLLVGQSGQRAAFTHHSFGQFCRRVGAPAAYLRTLPADLVVQNLRHGIASADEDRDSNDKERLVKLLMAKTEGQALRLRAVTGNAYGRIWNSDITSRLIRFTQERPEWQPAPAAFDGSRGLYAGEKDIFAFLVDNQRPIFESLPGGGLSRGFFVSNSEVGDASFRITTFLYEHVCGNHRVLGATGINEIRIPHIGAADDRAFRQMAIELHKYANSSTRDEEAKIESARRFLIGGTKDEVLDAVFGLRIPNLPKVTIEEGYDLAEQESDKYGNPRSAWGLAGGITQIARDLPNADDRVDLERAAGRVMQMAF